MWICIWMCMCSVCASICIYTYIYVCADLLCVGKVPRLKPMIETLTHASIQTFKQVKHPHLYKLNGSVHGKSIKLSNVQRFRHVSSIRIFRKPSIPCRHVQTLICHVRNH